MSSWVVVFTSDILSWENKEAKGTHSKEQKMDSTMISGHMFHVTTKWEVGTREVSNAGPTLNQIPTQGAEIL